MDRKYNDIHYITKHEEFVSREVEIKQIRFLVGVIEIDYEILGVRKTIVFPKLYGSKLVID